MHLKERKAKQVVLRLTPTLLAAIEETAAQERRTVADTLRIIVEDALVARRAAHTGSQVAA